MPRAALFDMDRTLVRKETASLYVRFQRARGEANLRDLARVLYWVTEYTLGVIDAPAVALRALAGYTGTLETVTIARCEEFFASHVEPHIAELGRAAVERHRADGDILAIVTGATPYVARPLAARLRIDRRIHHVGRHDGIQAHAQDAIGQRIGQDVGQGALVAG